MGRVFRKTPGPGRGRYFLFAGTALPAAAACCFFWFAELAFDCFWAAFLLTDFGDLSPMMSGFVFVRFREPQDRIPASGNTRRFHRTCHELKSSASVRWQPPHPAMSRKNRCHGRAARRGYIFRTALFNSLRQALHMEPGAGWRMKSALSSSRRLCLPQRETSRPSLSRSA